jgi:hypothetical protein
MGSHCECYTSVDRKTMFVGQFECFLFCLLIPRVRTHSGSSNAIVLLIDHKGFKLLCILFLIIAAYIAEDNAIPIM